MKIMTGKTGTPHVTSQQFRQFVEATVGQDSCILQSGENLEPELQTNNSLKIRSGIMAHHGNLSVVDLGTYDEVTIANGTQGRQRIDLVVNRYTRNESTGVEENEWVVIQGAAVTSNPSDPSYIEGNLQNGDLVDDCPVFRIHLNGINVTEVEKLLDVAPSIPTLNASLADITSLLSPDINEIYTSANGTVEGFKIGTVVRFSAIASDAVERSISYNVDYAPAVNSTFIPLVRNGVMIQSAVLSRDDANGRANLRYKAASGNAGTYTGWIAYATYS